MTDNLDAVLTEGSRWQYASNPDSVIRVDVIRRNEQAKIIGVSWTALPVSKQTGGGAPITHFLAMFAPHNTQPVDGQLSLQLTRTTE